MKFHESVCRGKITCWTVSISENAYEGRILHSEPTQSKKYQKISRYSYRYFVYRIRFGG